MIKKCNFKTINSITIGEYPHRTTDGCNLTRYACESEKNCILFQIYEAQTILKLKEKADRELEEAIRRYG